MIKVEEEKKIFMNPATLDAFNVVLNTETVDVDFLSIDAVKELHRQVKMLAEEVVEIGRHLHNVSVTEKDEVFTFDFDVVFSSVNWLSKEYVSPDIRSRDTFWSSLATELFWRDTLLLPGAGYELVSFLMFQSRAAQRIADRPLAGVFIEEFQRNFSPTQDVTKGFYSAISSLREYDFAVNTLFIISQLCEAHVSHPYIVERCKFEYDQEAYRDCFDYLMRHRGFRKPINTMVDAYNFAVNFELNRSSQYGEGTFHTLISNTKPLQNVPPQMSAYENRTALMEVNENGVASPRQAVLYRLINEISPDRDSAERFVIAWEQEIRSFQRYLAELLREFRDADSIPISRAIPADRVTSVIWGFEKLESRIRAVRSKTLSRLEAFKKTFKPSDVHEFTSKVVDFFNEQVLNSAMSKEFVSKAGESKGSGIDYTVGDLSQDLLSEFGFVSGFTAMSENGNFNFAKAKGELRFWSNTAGVDKTRFYSEMHRLVRRLGNKALRDSGAGQFTAEYSAMKLVQSGQWVFVADGNVHDVPSPLAYPLTESEIRKRAGFNPEEADLIRYECSAFAAATNGRKLTYRTNPMFGDDLLNSVQLIIDGAPLMADSIVKKYQNLERA